MKIGYLMQAGVPEMRVQPLSGPAKHVKHVISELQSLGHQVTLIAQLDNHIWKSEDLAAFTPIRDDRSSTAPLRLIERGVRRIQYELQLPYIALFESLRFARACRQELADCDIFYERMGWFGYGGALVSSWLDIPLVIEVNGDHLSEIEALGIPQRRLQRKLSIAVMARAMRNVAHVICTGEGWRDKFIERWDVEPEKLSVIENGSELVDLLERTDLSAFTAGVGEDAPITIVYLGAFEPWHGLSVLLESAAKAVAAGINLRVQLIGSGSELTNIQRQIAELGLGERVSLAGHLSVQQYAGILAAADLAVSPYCGRVEYSGLKLLDYKGAGLVTIASGADGQPAVLEHGKTGWIVPPCDADALAEAVIHLSLTPDLRKKMGREARMEAEMYHSWKNTAEQLVEVFRRVILEVAKVQQNY